MKNPITIATTFLCVAGLATPALVQAESGGSNKPIRLVVAFPPGGVVDATARVYAEHLSARLGGRPIVIENKPGAGGNLAADLVAKAAADGTVLLITSNNFTINQWLYTKLPFSTERDFAPVAQIADSPMVLVVNPKVAANSLPELVRLSKQKPDTLAFGTGGTGHPAHLAGELLKARTGLSFMHVPYKGSMQVMTDLVAGQIGLSIGSITAFQPFIKSGQLRALGVTTRSRWAGLPDVPTVAEAGSPGYHYSAWIGLFAPRGTPTPVIVSLQKGLASVAALPEVKVALAGQGAVPISSSTDEFVEMLRRDSAVNKKLIQDLGIKAD